MLFVHNLLAKLGFQTERYKAEIFKSKHPGFIILSTCVNDAMGRPSYDLMDYSWKEYIVSSIEGEGVFFARGKQEAYVAVGKAEFDLQLDEYVKRHTTSKYSGLKRVLDSSSRYRVAFDAVMGGTYRIRFHSDRHELEIVYERGEEHKIYKFS